MYFRLIALVLLTALRAVPGVAADLHVLESELARLSEAPDDAQSPGATKLSVSERRARLQEQANAIRKAIEETQRVIIVNVPAYTLTAYENGQPVLHSKVIVGSVARKTPMIETEVAAVQLNPAWNAPPSVVKGDLTRNGRIDERAVRKKGLTAFDGEGKPLPAEFLTDLSPEDRRRVRFYQAPGERNALGRVKVTLKGIPDVYLHDTPKRELFGKTRRAMSSGCVRVEQARELAAWVSGTSRADIDKLIDARATRTIAAQPTRVIVGYWLADTADERVVFLDDIYGRAARRAASSAPKDATVTALATAPERATIQAPVAAVPPTSASAATPAPAAAAAPVTTAAQVAAAAPVAIPAPVVAAAAVADAAHSAAAGVEPPRIQEPARGSETPVSRATAPRRAFITPATAAPWVGSYVRNALARLDLRRLRLALGWQLPQSRGPLTLTVAIDRNGYLRSADLSAINGFPALRALVQSHFDAHSRTVPFPEMLARDLDEITVDVALDGTVGS